MSDHCCGTTEADARRTPPERELPAAPAQADDHAHAGGSCCSGGVPVFDGVDPRYKTVLWTVIGINGAMFVTELAAGQLAGSQAAQGRRPRLPRRHRDLRPEPRGDRRVLGRPVQGGPVQGAVPVPDGALGVRQHRLRDDGPRRAQGRGHGRDRRDGAGREPRIGLPPPALQGTAMPTCARSGCARANDAIGNVVVMVAALGVWGTATAWPDLIVAAVMAGIFLTSSVQILRQAWAEHREGTVATSPAPAE